MKIAENRWFENGRKQPKKDLRTTRTGFEISSKRVWGADISGMALAHFCSALLRPQLSSTPNLVQHGSDTVSESLIQVSELIGYQEYQILNISSHFSSWDGACYGEAKTIC